VIDLFQFHPHAQGVLLLDFPECGSGAGTNQRLPRASRGDGDKNLLFEGKTVPKCHLGVNEKETTI